MESLPLQGFDLKTALEATAVLLRIAALLRAFSTECVCTPSGSRCVLAVLSALCSRVMLSPLLEIGNLLLIDSQLILQTSLLLIMLQGLLAATTL